MEARRQRAAPNGCYRLRAFVCAGILLLAAACYLARPLANLAGRLIAPAFAEDSHGAGDGGGDGGNGGGSGGSNGGNDGGDGGGGGDIGGDGGSNSGKGGSASPGPFGTSPGQPENGTAAGSNGAGKDFAAGEVVVLGDRPAVLVKATELGFRLIDNRPLQALGLSVLRLRAPGNMDSQAGLALLHQAMPQIVADVNSLYTPYKAQAAEVVSLPAPDYARRLIGWTGGSGCGAGFRIGMIDSAVNSGLPALAGQKLHQQAFLSDGAAPASTEHGTAIASLLVGRADPAHLDGAGLLPAADLYAASIFERHGDRIEASAFGIATALDWMVAQQVPVVNVSLSGDNNELMALAVKRATDRGTVLIAAAGNAGPGAPPSYPAALDDVIAVTAVDQNEAILPEANKGDYIAFAAPGVRIWTPDANGIGEYRTGTSFAAPFVAAAVAAEREAGAPANVDQLRQRLAAHAIDLGAPGKDPVFGYGLIQATGTCGVSASVQ